MRKFEIVSIIVCAIAIYITITLILSGCINHGFEDDTDTYVGAWFVGLLLFVSVVVLWLSGTPCPIG